MAYFKAPVEAECDDSNGMRRDGCLIYDWPPLGRTRWISGPVDGWTGGPVTPRFPGWVHLADSRDARGPLALPSIMGSGSPSLPFPYPSKIKAAAICTHKLKSLLSFAGSI